MIMPCGEAGIFEADISCLYRHISVRHIAAQPVADTAFISPLHAVIYFDNIGGAVLLFAAVAHMYIVECSAYSCKNIINGYHSYSRFVIKVVYPAFAVLIRTACISSVQRHKVEAVVHTAFHFNRSLYQILEPVFTSICARLFGKFCRRLR